MSQAMQSQDSGEELLLRKALPKFVAHQQGKSEETKRSYKNGVTALLNWCEHEGYETNPSTSDLSQMTLLDYRAAMVTKAGNEYSHHTVKTYIGGVKQFVKWCEQTGLVQRGRHEVIDSYAVPSNERKPDDSISYERFTDIVNWYQQHKPYHRDTIILSLIHDTGMRIVGLRAIDLGDVTIKKSNGTCRIELYHRPDTDTGLKEGDHHERFIPITKGLYDRIKRYVADQRVNGDDEHGRKPLLTTRYHGDTRRIGKTAIRDAVYLATCPLTTGVGECSCTGPPTKKNASKCDKSVSPHPLKHAVVTRYKNDGYDYDEIGKLTGNIAETLRLYYDDSDFEEREDQARSLLESL